MTNFFNNALASHDSKSSDRLISEADKVRREKNQQTFIASPSRYDLPTGRFVATQPDGSEILYKQGKNIDQPDKISVVRASGSQTGQGDW
jgi:hypothetical protein